MNNAKPALGRTRTHTSGEWTPEDNGIFFTINCDPFLNGKHAIAECFGPDREANADLIAAAPKTKAQRDALLAALNQIMDELYSLRRELADPQAGEVGDIADIAKAAIALAEKGE